MSDLTNKAAYLKGLADGMKLDTEKNEGKLLNEIIGFLSDVSEKIELLDDEQGFIADKLDEMDDVLELFGNELYGGDECDDDDTFVVTCENCGEEIEVYDEDLMDGSINCPNCGEEIEFEFDDDCDCECGCGCDECK